MGSPDKQKGARKERPDGPAQGLCTSGSRPRLVAQRW
jgi:hypothetical protein